jgi:hypothetical protein
VTQDLAPTSRPPSIPRPAAPVAPRAGDASVGSSREAETLRVIVRGLTREAAAELFRTIPPAAATEKLDDTQD